MPSIPLPPNVSLDLAAEVVAYASEYIRAMQPVSVTGLRRWLLEQLVGATPDNIDSLVTYFIAEGRRQLAFDTYTVTDSVQPAYEVIDFYENCH